MQWLLLAGALVAGMLLTVQAGVNASLSRGLENPVHGALVSFLIGTVTLVLYMLATRQGVPDVGKAVSLPIWIWTGGMLGAVYVTAVVIIAPRIGALSLASAIIAGQIAASLVLDQMGWLGFPRQPLNWERAIGVLLLIAGVVLIRRS